MMVSVVEIIVIDNDGRSRKKLSCRTLVRRCCSRRWYWSIMVMSVVDLKRVEVFFRMYKRWYKTVQPFEKKSKGCIIFLRMYKKNFRMYKTLVQDNATFWNKVKRLYFFFKFQRSPPGMKISILKTKIWKFNRDENRKIQSCRKSYRMYKPLVRICATFWNKLKRLYILIRG